MLIFTLIATLSIAPAFSVPDQANSNAKGKYFVSTESLKGPRIVDLPDGTQVERIVHIYYDKDFTHKPNHSGGKGGPPEGKGGGGDKEITEADCFSFKGAHWNRLVEDYIIDPNNGDGLVDVDILSKTNTSIDKWESAAGNFGIFGSGSINAALVDGVDESSPDGQNELLFGGTDDPNVIAFTVTWVTRGGPPSDRSIVEWDMLFNDDDYTFSNVDDPSGDVMDYQAIAAHELGHAAGLKHSPTDDICVDQTMYPTAAFHEIKKRTLELGDMAGILKLYS